jgi:hypothetical protein
MMLVITYKPFFLKGEGSVGGDSFTNTIAANLLSYIAFGLSK